MPPTSLRLTWVLPRPSLMGGIRTVRELGEAMLRRGHQCVVVVPRSQSSPRPWSGVSKVFREVWGKQHAHHLTDTKLVVLEGSSDVVTDDDVPDADFVIATWWKTREWLNRLRSRAGKPAYFVQHYETHSGDSERVRATYDAPSVKFAVARWLARTLAEQHGDDRVAVVPNGYERRWFHSPPRDPPRLPTFGFMYSERTWKGTHIATEALRLARLEVPDLRVVAFGEDRPRTRLFKGPFEYHRAPKQEMLADLYRSCTAWIVPSLTEGFGLPGLEAAACRCPLIATRSGGPEDYVVDGENGYLVPIDDVASIRDRVVELAHLSPTSWRKMSEANHDVAQQFDWNRSAELLERHLLAAYAA